MDAKIVLECLVGATDYTRRAACEAQLLELEQQVGYGFALVNIFIDEQVHANFRQLAGSVLRHFVSKHWDKISPKFTPPVVAEQEKVAIRNALPQMLSSSSSKLRTMTSMVIAEVSSFDFPEKWPELMPGLLQGLQDQNPLMVRIYIYIYISLYHYFFNHIS